MSRRWRHPYARRGEFFQGPRAVVPQAPSLVPSVSRARLRFAVAPLRGRFFAGPRLVVVAAPPFIPPLIRQAGEYRLRVRARRGAFRVVPQPVTALPVVQRGAIHAGSLRARPGHVASPPFPQVAPSPPPFPPRLARGRVRLAVAQRDGRFVAPPLQVAVQQPPSFPPRTVRGRARLAAIRRGEFAFPTQPPLAQPQQAWVPPFTVGHRSTPAARRGRFIICPTTSSGVPAPLTGHRSGARPRRGRFTCPPWTVAPLIGRTSVRRRTTSSARSGCYMEPPWPQAIPPAPPLYVPVVAKGRRGVPALRVHGRMMPGWMALTTSPVVEGVAVLSSGSTQVVGMTTTSDHAASLTSSDTTLITLGGDG